jgi:hypothetical protein
MLASKSYDLALFGPLAANIIFFSCFPLVLAFKRLVGSKRHNWVAVGPLLAH